MIKSDDEEYIDDFVSIKLIVIFATYIQNKIRIMTEEEKKQLSKDEDGLRTYEYIANHIDACDQDLEFLLENMRRVDQSGQFLVSMARYLHAIDAAHYRDAVNRLIADAIERDREHRYIAALLPDIWGNDYADHVDELNKTDDNFRRVYKRVFPTGLI